MKKMTYKNSGVDIDEKEEAIKQLLSSIMTKRKGTIGRPMGGHYAGLIEFGDYALVLCTDGVGTKVKIAEALKKYDTIGIDCIAMNVNDALCVGAEPLAFVDYLAMEDPNPKITKEIGKGTGLGHFISNNLVTEIGGTIQLKSTEGRGTTVIIRIPVMPKVGMTNMFRTKEI